MVLDWDELKTFTWFLIAWVVLTQFALLLFLAFGNLLAFLLM